MMQTSAGHYDDLEPIATSVTEWRLLRFHTVRRIRTEQSAIHATHGHTVAVTAG